MKINSKSIPPCAPEVVVIPRGEEDIVFTCAPVVDYVDSFKKLYPEPLPPTKHVRGKGKIEDINHPDYLKAVEKRNSSRMAFLVLKSLEATEGLEWETVSLSDNTTWSDYLDEMKAAGLSDIEVTRIVEAVLKANAMDSEALDEARERFLLTQAEQNEE